MTSKRDSFVVALAASSEEGAFISKESLADSFEKVRESETCLFLEYRPEEDAWVEQTKVPAVTPGEGLHGTALTVPPGCSVHLDGKLLKIIEEKWDDCIFAQSDFVAKPLKAPPLSSIFDIDWKPYCPTTMRIGRPPGASPHNYVDSSDWNTARGALADLRLISKEYAIQRVIGDLDWKKIDDLADDQVDAVVMASKALCLQNADAEEKMIASVATQIAADDKLRETLRNPVALTERLHVLFGGEHYPLSDVPYPGNVLSPKQEAIAKVAKALDETIFPLMAELKFTVADTHVNSNSAEPIDYPRNIRESEERPVPTCYICTTPTLHEMSGVPICTLCAESISEEKLPQ